MSAIFAGKRILVAEDNALLRIMMADMLLEMGFAEVSEAHSLAGMLILAKDQPPDVALLEIHLTDGASASLADNLAALKIPCIFMTGFAPDAADVAPKGIPVLTKPFAPATLQDALRLAMGLPSPD
jgi:CheY-like chemotaxis protein